MSFFFTGELDSLLSVTLFSLRVKIGFEGRIFPFPSGALLSWKIDLSLDMLLSNFSGVVPVRRREKADGNRYSGVKVQVDDFKRRELFSNAFRSRKEDKKGSLASGGKKGGRKRPKTLLSSVLFFQIVG